MARQRRSVRRGFPDTPAGGKDSTTMATTDKGKKGDKKDDKKDDKKGDKKGKKGK